MTSGKPEYRDRFPCHGCQCGYLDCASYASFGQKCCPECAHPERFTAVEPFTAETIEAMAKEQLRSYYAEEDWFTWDSSSDAYKTGWDDGYRRTWVELVAARRALDDANAQLDAVRDLAGQADYMTANYDRDPELAVPVADLLAALGVVGKT